MENIYEFYKEKSEWDSERWYIDIPDYPGHKAELEMVEGADTMLDFILDLSAEEGNKVKLKISLEPFEGSSEIVKQQLNTLDQKLANVMTCGGWYYMLKNYEGFELNIEMWLCDVTKFVFGNFPEKIYIKKV